MVRKRYSKKSKSSWRKRTDISDVEAHLEEVRRDKRLGGPASLKSNDELFYLERDVESVKSPKSDQALIAKDKKKKKRKPLTCESVLESTSKVKPLKKSNSKSYKLETELRNNKKLIEKIKNSKKELAKNDTRGQVYDLWLNNDSRVEKDDRIVSNMNIQVKRPSTIAQQEVKVPNVRLCGGGASYNPSFDDHQALLRTAVDEEVKSVKKQEKLDRKVAPLVDTEHNELLWKKEMSCGLFQEDTKEDEVSTSGSDVDLVSNVRAKANRRYTLREKKLQKIRKAQAMVEKDLKIKKSRMQDIYRLRKIKSNLKDAKKLSEEKLEMKERKLANAKSLPKRLGKYAYEESKVDVKLSTELTGSLRTSSVEGNLFKDRFKNFQKRGIIEPRKPIGAAKKRRVKFYVRKSYRD